MRTMPFLPTLVHISSIMVGSSELNSTIPIHFSSQILKKSVCNLAISCLTLSNLTWFMDLTFQVPVLLYSIRLYFQHQYIHCWLSVPLWPSCVTLSGAISNCPLLFPSSIEDTFWSGKGGGGGSSSGVVFFAFSYSSWCSCSKNTGVGCHFLFWWTTFCWNSHYDLSWMALHGMAHSFIEFASSCTLKRLWLMKGDRSFTKIKKHLLEVDQFQWDLTDLVPFWLPPHLSWPIVLSTLKPLPQAPTNPLSVTVGWFFLLQTCINGTKLHVGLFIQYHVFAIHPHCKV